MLAIPTTVRRLCSQGQTGTPLRGSQTIPSPLGLVQGRGVGAQRLLPDHVVGLDVGALRALAGRVAEARALGPDVAIEGEAGHTDRGAAPQPGYDQRNQAMR